VLDRTEFAALFTGSYRKLWLVAAGMLADRTGADDVVQEAAVVALEKLEQFQPNTNFTAWMAKIVRLKAINWVRTRSRRATALTDPVALDRSNAAPDENESHRSKLVDGRNFDDSQTLFDDRVVAALRSLGETARACLLLRTVEQLPYSEIADILAIPQGTAMSHVHRAKRSLRDQLTSRLPAARTPK